jgi:integrase
VNTNDTHDPRPNDEPPVWRLEEPSPLAGTPISQEQFTAYLAMQGFADSSIRSYRAMFLRWVDYAIAEGHDPYRPAPLAVHAWAAQITGSRSLLAQARATIGHLCGALEVMDVSSVISLPRKPRSQARGLSHENAVKLAEEAKRSGTKGTAVLVALYTAARRSEVASLAWSNIMWDANLLTLVRPKTRDLHTIPLHPGLKSHLELRYVRGERWVFPGRHGGHVAPATVWGWVVEVAEAAGLGHVNVHALRHTSLTEAYDATGDLRAVQDMAGHVNPEVTARYTRTSAKRLNAAVGSLNYDILDEVPEVSG